MCQHLAGAYCTLQNGGRGKLWGITMNYPCLVRLKHAMLNLKTIIVYFIICGTKIVHAFARCLVIFTFAAAVAVDSTVSLNGPLGSGRSGFCFTGWKYFKIYIDMEHVFVPVNSFLIIVV